MDRFNLKKLDGGERFTLSKDFGLDNIRVELTWQNGDLDAQAWLLNQDGVIVNDEGFVFYNSVNRTNIVLNKIEKKKKEVVTKAENNYLSSE